MASAEPGMHYTADAEGVVVRALRGDVALPLKEWPTATASSLSMLAHDPAATQLALTHAQLATLDEFSAVALGLPRYAEAWLSVRISGRIESPHFRVSHALEPLQYAHAWQVYARLGALLTVGERQLRLNLSQYSLFEALDAMQRAGDDVAARLAAWGPLMQALQAQARQPLVRLDGVPPRVQLQTVAQFPPTARVREGGALRAPTGTERWAMAPRHRYYLRTA